MESSKAKCKILHLDQADPKHRYRLGREWIKASPGEKDLGEGVVFLDERFSMTGQCALAAQKANHILVSQPVTQHRAVFKDGDSPLSSFGHLNKLICQKTPIMLL